MYAAVRRYANAKPLIDEMARRSQEIEDLIASVPGFIAYRAVRAGDRLATFTVCEDRAGTTESTRRAAEWVKQNLKGVSIPEPDVTEGDVFFDFGQ